MTAGLLAIPQIRAERPSWLVNKKGFEMDLRSSGRQLADDILAGTNQMVVEPAEPGTAPALTSSAPADFRGGNVLVNDGALQNIQVLPGQRPFVKYTQSETSIAVHQKNIVAGFNNSSDQGVYLTGPNSLGFTHRYISGFATSNDGGKTWIAGSVPPAPGSIFTFGDPSVDKDRHGNFYYAGLGTDAAGRNTIQVNKSTDGGRTWSPGVIVQQDNGGDKEWLAVGRDPNVAGRDNVYVTWTSFQGTGAQLRFGRSIDGAATWQTKTIFAPAPHPNPAYPQNSIQFSNPYVDPANGDLYVPFLHFSESNQDFIRILVSRDAGETFTFATFNDPTAPLPTLLTVTQPGTLVDCGTNGGFRLCIHAGPNLGGRFGLPQYARVSRLVVQPALAARGGVVYLAWSNSTSLVFGAPTSGAEILFIRSDDGGQTWSTPVIANPAIAGDNRHVLPALAIGQNSNDVYTAYYTQHANGTVDVDLARSSDGGLTFAPQENIRVTSQPTALAPTNVRLPPYANPASTTNYDRLIRPGYNLGEYISVRAEGGSVHVLWADGRNSVTHPVNPLDPLSGVTHEQQDVFYQRLSAH